jgi:hypothetical protein
MLGENIADCQDKMEREVCFPGAFRTRRAMRAKALGRGAVQSVHPELIGKLLNVDRARIHE